MRQGAAGADAVIHAAFGHDFSRFVESCEADERVVGALGAELAGSERPLIVTSGTGMGLPEEGGPAIESVFNKEHPNPRRATELKVDALLREGINVSVVRLPQVHNPLRQGLVTPLVEVARDKRVVAYVGEGRNRWPAGHLSDVVRLFRLAVEAGERGARYHAVGETGITLREIAEALGRNMRLPVVSLAPADAAAHFGWCAMFAAMDMPASSAWTQARLNWRPSGPGLIEDLDQGRFF